jgi:hypothetical protein
VRRFDAPALACAHTLPPPACPAAMPRGEKHATLAGLRPVRDDSGGLPRDLQRLWIPLSVATAMLRRVCEQAYPSLETSTA